ncbi:MAG: flagellar hook capping FlgD N-terminal domain-containing protein [Pararhodobacter sp.]
MNPISAGNPAASHAAPSARSAVSPNAGQADYLTFLNMLTVQMQNQDPLNPMASTDFAVQLATFSGVEQQVMTNQLLSSLIERSALADLDGWVGMEARVAGPAWFDGNPITLAPEPLAGADGATLVVRDAMGSIVDRRDMPTDALHFTWHGIDGDGMPLPEGRYSFYLELRTGDTLADSVPVPVYQPVREARRDGGQTVLLLEGGLLVDSAQVSGVRAPQPALE